MTSRRSRNSVKRRTASPPSSAGTRLRYWRGRRKNTDRCVFYNCPLSSSFAAAVDDSKGLCLFLLCGISNTHAAALDASICLQHDPEVVFPLSMWLHGCQMSHPEQVKNLIDEDALQRAREKRKKVDHGVTEKVSITKRMYGALDTCIKNIGTQGTAVRVVARCRPYISHMLLPLCGLLSASAP